MPRDALANPVALPALGALLERPMHPYQLAGVLAERGVPVNRGSVYDTVQAMARAGWVEPLPAERAGTRPQRTPYTLTEDGRAELVRRLDAQIRTPRREFPEFLGAVSHIGVLGPARAAQALTERAGRLATLITDDQQRLDDALEGGRDGQSVPRLFVIEAEYALALLRAERDWLLALTGDITSGRLAWPKA
jgi:DNA-binding PadR family transcriptional regulator